jgi:hypothetical protein
MVVDGVEHVEDVVGFAVDGEETVRLGVRGGRRPGITTRMERKVSSQKARTSRWKPGEAPSPTFSTGVGGVALR